MRNEDASPAATAHVTDDLLPHLGLARTDFKAQRRISFIEHEKGMFSFLGVNKDQIHTLIHQYSIYLVGSSRINIASINDDNIDYLVNSIKAVL